MSGSSEYVGWNACVHRLDFGLYSHPKVFFFFFFFFLGGGEGGMGSEPMSTPREKSPLPEAQRRIEPTTLHQAETASPTHYRQSYFARRKMHSRPAHKTSPPDRRLEVLVTRLTGR